ncbi:MAG: hypothetical protein ACFFCS_12865 [Candidatus Hodarchaeota archaeon]
MQSIKISNKTKEKIEKKQAELLLESNKKVTQSELLEKIVEKAIDDPDFMDELFPNGSRVITPQKKEVNITIAKRHKAIPRFFEDEWGD